MRIKTFQTDKYKRFALNQISSLFMTMTERVQLILGTNGCGKSSMMRELSPLPAVPSNYVKGGQKVITIEHRGHDYILTSTMSGGAGKHSFKRALKGSDEYEELNEGGTVTVQKELAKRYFDYTDDVHRLLVGTERFTEMTPARRREWFTRLSDVKYDYALYVYEKLREQLRDTTGALKRTSKNLVIEKAKMISEEEEIRLKNDVAAVQGHLSLLQSIQAPVINTRQHYTDRAAMLSRDMHKVGNSAMRLTHELETLYRSINNDVSVEQRLEQLKGGLAANATVMGMAYDDFKHAEDTVKILRKSGAEGVGVLRGKLAALEDIHHGLTAMIQLHLEFKDSARAHMAFNSCVDALTDIISHMPSNDDRKFSAASLASLNERKRELTEKTFTYRQTADKLRSEARQMEYHKEHNRLECPMCRYGWAPNYNADVHHAKIEETENLLQQANVLENELTTTLQAQLEEFESYRKLYGEYVRLTQNYPDLRSFWDHIGELVGTTPALVQYEINSMKQDFAVLENIRTADQQIKNMLVMIQDAESVGDANLAESEAKLKEIEERIATLNAERIYLQDQVSLHSRIIDMSRSLEKDRNYLETLMTMIKDNTAEAVESEFRQIIKEEIHKCQIELAIKTEALTSVSLQKNYVMELERSLATMTLEEEALKVLIKELSPTEGLIADGLLGFIRIFTRQINKVIQRICTYKLHVLPCGIDSEHGAELNYKFPFLVLSEDNKIPDIEEASEGQKEIINLAFKIVAMQQMGFKDYPLYLDEFGKALDVSHRNAADHAIQQILEQCSFSQLFMVSHYESSYGSFANAEICVLDARNISTPATYNEHVVFA